MTSKYDAVLYTITGTCRTHNKGYCYPSQNHIIELVKKYHKVVMSRSTLNRVLDRIESDGHFYRVRRHTKKSDGSLWLRSTLYVLCGKFREFVIRKLRWACGMLGVSAVPEVTQHNSFKERKVSSKGPCRVEKAWESSIEGKPPPVFQRT